MIKKISVLLMMLGLGLFIVSSFYQSKASSFSYYDQSSVNGNYVWAYRNTSSGLTSQGSYYVLQNVYIDPDFDDAELSINTMVNLGNGDKQVFNRSNISKESKVWFYEDPLAQVSVGTYYFNYSETTTEMRIYDSSNNEVNLLNYSGYYMRFEIAIRDGLTVTEGET